MCDCVIFLNDQRIVLVEMKRKNVSIGDVEKQFLNAGKRSLGIARDAGIDYEIACMLLLTRYRTNHALKNYMLAVPNIRISGKDYAITRGRCGCRLEALLKKCSARRRRWKGGR